MFIFIFLIIIMIIITSINIIYRKNWGKKLKINIMFNKDGIFEGEKGEVHETITNTKFMPVWWGDIQFFVSHFIKFDGSNIDHDYYKEDIVSVLSYEKVKRVLPFTALKRGYYTIEKSEIITDDLFFKYRYIKKFPTFTELYVYPDIKSVKNLNIDFRKIVGEVITKRNMIEDPFEFRGIRDYYPFDDLRTVNWKASAKTGDIKVNEYNYTASQKVMILLDFDGYNSWDKQAVKEDVIRIGAYLIREFIKNNIPAGFASNVSDSITGKEIKTLCKNGMNHNLFLYKQMAKINTENISRPFNDVMDDLIKNNDAGYQYILISYYSGIDAQNEVSRFKSWGLSLKWVVVKDKFRKSDIESSKDVYVCEVVH